MSAWPTESQIGTQRSGKRPYGVGLLIIGSDVSLFCEKCAVAFPFTVTVISFAGPRTYPLEH